MTTTMSLLISTSAVILALAQRGVAGNDNVQPRQLTPVSGDTVRMECNRTAEGSVNWTVEYDPKEYADKYVCHNGTLMDQYKPRFQLDPDNYTLTIHDVMVSDSGIYYCIDNNGQKHYTRLDVGTDNGSVFGDTVRMECNRSVEGIVDWKLHNDQEDNLGSICNNGRLVDKYKPRFELDPDNYTLTIHNVTANYSGLYYCVDSNGHSHYTRLHVVLPPPGQLSLVNRTDSSLTIHFNQTGYDVTGYNVSINDIPTSYVTYSGIGQEVITATVYNLIPGSRHVVSFWGTSNGVYSKTSTTANYSTFPAAPGPLRLVSWTDECMTISWNQTGRVTNYTTIVDDNSRHDVEYNGVGTESVTAVFCGLTIDTIYRVSITAISDDDTSQATSGDFETVSRDRPLKGVLIFWSVFVTFYGVSFVVIICVIEYLHCQENINWLSGRLALYAVLTISIACMMAHPYIRKFVGYIKFASIMLATNAVLLTIILSYACCRFCFKRRKRRLQGEHHQD